MNSQHSLKHAAVGFINMVTKVVSIISHNRPQYLQQVARSLSRNDLKDWRVVLVQNPTEKASYCIQLCETVFKDLCDFDVVMNKVSLGYRHNSFKAGWTAFWDYNADICILLEDDTPVSSDVTAIADYYLTFPSPGMSLAYYIHRNIDCCPAELIRIVPHLASNLTQAIRRESWIKCWEPSFFRYRENSKEISYSRAAHLFSTENNIHSYQPAIRRTTHIGHEGGAHAKAHESIRLFHDKHILDLPPKTRLNYFTNDGPPIGVFTNG